MKYCNKCHRLLPETQFQADHSRPDGLQFYCRSCRNRAYRDKVGGLPTLLARFTDGELEGEVERRRAQRICRRAQGRTAA